MAAFAVVVVGVRLGADSDSESAPATTVQAPEAATPVTAPPVTTSSTAPPTPRTVSTLSAALGPGRAGLSGAVVGPEGPVPGATVRIERLLGDAVAPATVMTDASGQWALGGINGGRYRVRAWRPPDLTALEATVFFLSATETKNVGLAVARYGADSVGVSMTPDPPVEGQQAMLVVTLSTGAVDAEGVLQATARPGVPVQLAPGPALVVESAPAVATDAGGNAAFAVRCTAAGTQPAASAVIAGVSRALEIPACAPG